MALANRYRPQTFAQVAGQDLVKTVLSRAALEDRPACAYLFSGTRGVGKTTVARIFAKTLNCERAPAAEPCNACPQCERITRGIHVDVTEIDGASNNGVEDARSLRENIGYAPMEGRYKIFIIDEAHMLSRSAFNALLKTLEEPPPRVVFIFATTEAHRFPATIISRCQHFIFRHLDDSELVTHLARVQKSEGFACDGDALSIIAQRAAGSVRDAMSLLDQVLALGQSELTGETCRKVLGLAGLALHRQILEAVLSGDCGAIISAVRQLFSQGADIGFFMRELASNLRNFFLLRKAGEGIIPALNLGAGELGLCSLASRFSPAHLHACWQMALEAQRNITRSPEPSAALELLLLNMAFLPQLMPVEQVRPLPGGCSAPGNPCPGENARPHHGEPSCTRPVEAKAATAREKFVWDDFVKFFLAENKYGPRIPAVHLLRAVDASLADNRLVLMAKSVTAAEGLAGREADFGRALADFCGIDSPEVKIVAPAARPSESELIEQFSRRPELGPCLEILGATITHCKAVDSPKDVQI